MLTTPEGDDIVPQLREILVLCLVCLTYAAPLRGQQSAETYVGVFDELRRLAPRADRVAAVRDLVLQRDVARFRLAEGKLYLLTSVSGRTVGAAFVGSGSVSFAAPLEVERNYLKRVLGDTTLNAPIRAAVFLFTDSTLAEIERRVSFGPGTVDPPAADRVGDALDFLVDGRTRWADPTLMTALLNGAGNGYFAAYLKRERGEDVMVKVDPLEVEEVQLLRRGQLEGQRVETVNQFQGAEDLQRGVAAAVEHPDPLRVESYRIDARIDNSFHFSAAVTVRLTARRDAGRWARFVLFDELDVDSVVSDSGAPLTHFRTDRNAGLWVRFDAPVLNGQARAFRIVYHGPLIEHGSLMRRYAPPWWSDAGRHMPPMLDNWAFIRATWSWFPRYGSAEPAAMDMTFQTPRGMQFASIGRLVETRTEGDNKITRWVTEVPTSVASFNIGQFEEFTITDPRIPPVTVLINQDAHRYIAQLFPHARNSQEFVGADVANSLSFFSTTYGPPLFERYYATEIPYFHGEAFPGLMHLSWWTFLGMSEQGNDESFRAHEMAHQWWGIGVEPASYRDWWLAEGFAEFSGLWYMQLILRDNANYFRQLRESRQEIRRQRDRAAPIGLGQRAAENRSGQYELVVYQKGAWVLHMLRNLMLDTRTMNEDRFGQMMRDFYTSYRGRRASTEDFQRVVERHLNRPMDWFFRQWVYGTAVPTYTFSWQAERQSDGKHLLRFRVRQEDVPDDFVMFVPLLIEFAEGGQAIIRLNVRGRVTEGQVPLPGEPSRLQLNPLESVLAEVREERWR